MSIATRHISVHGVDMAYADEGEGRPIVFLHGNPTSSRLWRDVMPELTGIGRLIAPDLIGMGLSAKLPDAGPDTYTFATHRRYLEGFLAALQLDRSVILVIHDWGSALGFDWAFNNPGAVAGIAYMEGIVQPIPTWEDFPEAATSLFQALRSDAGESLILKKNVFIENILPGSVLRELSEAEMDRYRAPFLKQQDRWPTLTWPRQIPIAGRPKEVADVVQTYAAWMAENDLPKLFINAEPGAILTGQVREFCRTWRNQTEVTVPGRHFIQEDSGPEIGRAIAAWLSATGA